MKKSGLAPPAPKVVRAPESVKKVSRNQASQSSDLPFNDEIYAHLKFAIEKLSSRMKSPTRLSNEDLSRLEVSINAIINDAKGIDSSSVPASVPAAMTANTATVQTPPVANGDKGVSLAG